MLVSVIVILIVIVLDCVIAYVSLRFSTSGVQNHVITAFIANPTLP